MRTFSTGATRDSDNDKLDFEGFLSPLVLERFAKYMHEHRVQHDGKLRDSDNWQREMPKKAYQSSMIRHMMTAWMLWRGCTVKPERVAGKLRTPTLEDALCAIIFNAQGLLLESIKGGIPAKPLVYLACPYSHPNDAVRRSRFEAVTKVLKDLTVAGEIVFSPITQSHPVHELGHGGDWKTWERIDRAFLSCCSRMIVLTLPGWKSSVGVAAEIAIAKESGMPIEYRNP